MYTNASLAEFSEPDFAPFQPEAKSSGVATAARTSCPDLHCLLLLAATTHVLLVVGLFEQAFSVHAIHPAVRIVGSSTGFVSGARVGYAQ